VIFGKGFWLHMSAVCVREKRQRCACGSRQGTSLLFCILKLCQWCVQYANGFGQAHRCAYIALSMSLGAVRSLSHILAKPSTTVTLGIIGAKEGP
jgi:hypothetical protein